MKTPHFYFRLHPRYGAARLACSCFLLGFFAGCSKADNVAITATNVVRATPSTARPSSQNMVVQTQKYTWKNVPIEGMGFVDGLVVHPTVPDTVYIRTDVGGVYRWDETNTRWLPLLDKLDKERGAAYDLSVESIALDASNANTVYIALDGATPDILRSDDKGTTWRHLNIKTSLGQDVAMGGNAEYRNFGERLAVDPNNGKVIYFGSRQNGLIRSMDGGATWKKVDGLKSVGVDKAGLPFVLFDASSGTKGQSSRTIYIGVAGEGVYRSGDAGASWQLLKGGAPIDQFPARAVVAKNGALYVAHASKSGEAGGVWRWKNNAWADVSPADHHRAYVGIAADPKNPQALLAYEHSFSAQTLYRSTDGGAHWTQLAFTATKPAWWPDYELKYDGAYGYSGALVFDAMHQGRVWATDGFGAFRTDNVLASPSHWDAQMNNLEEFVVTVVKSPPVPGGAALFSGVHDLDGFRHATLDKVPAATFEGQTTGQSVFTDTGHIEYSEGAPQIMARVGSGRGDGISRPAYSQDNGKTWRRMTLPQPGAINGVVALSAKVGANGHPTIVWLPDSPAWKADQPNYHIAPFRSTDGGQTWTASVGAPDRAGPGQIWINSQMLAADRVNPDLFYLYVKSMQDADGKWHSGCFYRSDDAGATWQRVYENLQGANGLPDWYQVNVKTVPGVEGEIWISFHNGQKLFRSTDKGATWTAVAGVQTALQVAFGKPAPGHRKPTVFVYGDIRGIGIYRSDDALEKVGSATGATWLKISTDAMLVPSPSCMEGDERVFGRVYIGTGGRGIFVGE